MWGRWSQQGNGVPRPTPSSPAPHSGRARSELLLQLLLLLSLLLLRAMPRAPHSPMRTGLCLESSRPRRSQNTRGSLTSPFSTLSPSLFSHVTTLPSACVRACVRASVRGWASRPAEPRARRLGVCAAQSCLPACAHAHTHTRATPAHRTTTHPSWWRTGRA